MMLDSQSRDLAERFDIESLTEDFYDDPYPWYRALRTYAPVKRMASGALFVTRYDDVAAIYRDPERFSSDKRQEFGAKYGDSLLFQHHTTSLVFNDPPLHTRVRRLITGALTPRAVAAMQPDLLALVDGLLDRMAEKGRVELIADFAAAIPIEVIGNLLGVPRDAREPLRDWSLAILGALEPVPSQAVLDRGNAAVGAFLDYLQGLIASRRAHPSDPDHDVLTRLIAGEVGGERLTEAELLHNCIFLLNAGHETTTNLIGNGLFLLLENPVEKSRLIANPALIKTAIEEILRAESSNQLGNRMTVMEARIGDISVPAGTLVTLCIGAANRDPEQFTDPEQFDVTRTPNRHLSFAGGIHQCAGMSLARLEGQIALSRFLGRFPRYCLDGKPVRGGRVRFRGFHSLPACVEP